MTDSSEKPMERLMSVPMPVRSLDLRTIAGRGICGVRGIRGGNRLLIYSSEWAKTPPTDRTQGSYSSSCKSSQYEGSSIWNWAGITLAGRRIVWRLPVAYRMIDTDQKGIPPVGPHPLQRLEA